MVVQARLDAASKRTLERLKRKLGKSYSEVVREGLRALAALHPAGSRRIIGQGEFASRFGDLSTNKKYMRDFGK